MENRIDSHTCRSRRGHIPGALGAGGRAPAAAGSDSRWIAGKALRIPTEDVELTLASRASRRPVDSVSGAARGEDGGRADRAGSSVVDPRVSGPLPVRRRTIAGWSLPTSGSSSVLSNGSEAQRSQAAVGARLCRTARSASTSTGSSMGNVPLDIFGHPHRAPRERRHWRSPMETRCRWGMPGSPGF